MKIPSIEDMKPVADNVEPEDVMPLVKKAYENAGIAFEILFEGGEDASRSIRKALQKSFRMLDKAADPSQVKGAEFKITRQHPEGEITNNLVLRIVVKTKKAGG